MVHIYMSTLSIAYLSFIEWNEPDYSFRIAHIDPYFKVYYVEFPNSTLTFVYHFGTLLLLFYGEKKL